MLKRSGRRGMAEAIGGEGLRKIRQQKFLGGWMIRY
jgi:hypothetical protein